MEIVKVQRIRDVELPAYGRKGDAGMDIRAAIDVLIRPGETVAIPTGICVSIPEGYEIQMRPRSGMSLKTKLRLANTPGTIDSGYRGEMHVILDNISRDIDDDYTLDVDGNAVFPYDDRGKHGNYFIKKGDRIAQILLCKYEQVEWQSCESVTSEKTDRGQAGFGSTGMK